MILPIYVYGHPILKKIASDIDPDYPELTALIEDMWETMYQAKGVGLAAPQIGRSIRLFVIDTMQAEEEDQKEPGLKKVFINARKIEEGGDLWTYEEGCLSIPEVRGDVDRPAQIHLRYLDEHFTEHEEIFTGINARVIQHEYDHLDGILFTDKLKPIKRRLVRRKLENIKKGKTDVDYRVKFPKR